MKTQMIAGLVLVLVGVALFVLQATGVFVDRAGIDIGGVGVAVESQRDLPWLPWVAGGGAIVGVLLMLTSRR